MAPIYPPIQPYINTSIYPSIQPYINTSIYPSIHPRENGFRRKIHTSLPSNTLQHLDLKTSPAKQNKLCLFAVVHTLRTSRWRCTEVHSTRTLNHLSFHVSGQRSSNFASSCPELIELLVQVWGWVQPPYGGSSFQPLVFRILVFELWSTHLMTVWRLEHKLTNQSRTVFCFSSFTTTN